jgi:MoxR-like ATPase
MNKRSFYRWLQAIKKYDQATCNSILSSCQKIEKYYGNLDEIYDKDKCKNLKQELKELNSKNNIPIDVDMHVETAALRNALNLYLEFKENQILQDIMTMEDVTPDEHDGSYELVRETVESFSKIDINKIDVSDLDLLYFMAIGLWKGGVEYRIKKIEESNLNSIEKNRLKTVFNNVIEKAKNYKYENRYENNWTIGMFGTGFYTFKGKLDKEDAQKFISLCISIKDLEDEEEILKIAERALKEGIKGMQAASASAILHCLKPNVFPIINNVIIDTAVLLESEGVLLVRPKHLATYIENVRRLKKFRDEKCTFRNYRALDLKLQEVEELEEKVQFNDPIDISKEQWIEMLSNPQVFREEDRKLIITIYKMGGQATASELAELENKHPSSYNFKVVNLSKRIHRYTNCNVPRRRNGKESWWHIPFLGRYRDDGTFSWILRPELKEAIREMYSEIKDKIEEEPKTVDDTINYWWLNADPKIWSFSDVTIGQVFTYSSKSERGNKKKIYKHFESVKKGDKVILYELSPVKAIVGIGHISQEHDGERIWITKDEDLIEPIEYSYFSSLEELKSMQFLVNPQGTLFKLTKEEYEILMDIIREYNPTTKVEIHKAYTKEDFLEEVFMEESQYDTISSLVKYKKNVILQGPPGVGKTFIAKRLAYSIMGEKDDSRIEMVQFHQSYTYEDFIMGYRPEEEGFKLKYGIFYKFCKRALNEPHKPYFFIIDEINRGNISKIFGELMLLIEADKRGSEYAIPLTYTENKFYIPENLYIIGTMNTADRSLAMLDYALRRRFCFINIEPAFDNLHFRAYLESKWGEFSRIIIEKMISLNETICNDSALGWGFRIGHSYFCIDKATLTEEDYKNIIQYEILPLLSEYWFDDDDRVLEWKRELLEW